jgi:hypothetical protein
LRFGECRKGEGDPAPAAVGRRVVGSLRGAPEAPDDWSRASPHGDLAYADAWTEGESVAQTQSQLHLEPALTPERLAAQGSAAAATARSLRAVERAEAAGQVARGYDDTTRRLTAPMRADIWTERRTRRSDDWKLTDSDELPIFPALREVGAEARAGRDLPRGRVEPPHRPDWSW